MTLKLERRENKSPMALGWCIEGGMHWYVHDVLPSSLLVMAGTCNNQVPMGWRGGRFGHRDHGKRARSGQLFIGG
ncbi:hypothetical protein HBI56_096730 [Parastagonospora nodorum]|uniref:Uncharacterized protein n=1 Tax=Phaeosphaeria nodorum (strain SN15 / ATCC MYA-4574 / FGSC 10173) TaxID=321614 RepID=A0A7U2F466_PHANO|nr:hypothetical protein HBH56_092110 [Parastagonospora nodorum]QRC98357.1 hypothetical protein JI435_044250 [Parastagonospora nodorum SN15]KAH3936171.1 hypothetical protein HBH54_026760 [Parastagonospora nodorum]KAH3957732.1 hypothetical protein HBH51_221640 [Parastagonospora nodorum]KAH4034446.1 hypothetical protein HBI09_110630 [Parastagonospora nodorum]